VTDDAPFDLDDLAPDGSSAGALVRVQCPNCCRLAFVVRRELDLLFYRCELCGTVGAMPEPPPGDG
jgi:hypothetical protein